MTKTVHCLNRLYKLKKPYDCESYSTTRLSGNTMVSLVLLH